MILDDDFKEITVLFGTNATIHFLTDLFGDFHSLVQLQICYFLLEQILLTVEF